MPTCIAGWSTVLTYLRHGGFEELLGLAVLRLLVQVACLQVLLVVRDRDERWLDRPALVHNVGAARVETAAARRAQQRRRLARDLDEPFEIGVEARQRPEQPPRGRVMGPPEEP